MTSDEKTVTANHAADPVAGRVLVALGAMEIWAIKQGDQIRVVTGRGAVAEGIVTRTFGIRGSSADYFWIGAQSFVANSMATYRVEGLLIEESIPRHTFDETVVLTIVRALESQAERRDGKPTLVHSVDIVSAALGFDPTSQKRSSEYGGKSKDGWLNEFLSVAQLNRVLDSLVASGALRKISTKSSDQSEVAAVATGWKKSGWVTEEAIKISLAHRSTEQNTTARARLEETARSNIADRHAAEVQVELARLIAEAGI
jgi:hypothetical protein